MIYIFSLNHSLVLRLCSGLSIVLVVVRVLHRIFHFFLIIFLTVLLRILLLLLLHHVGCRGLVHLLRVKLITIIGLLLIIQMVLVVVVLL